MGRESSVRSAFSVLLRMQSSDETYGMLFRKQI